MGSPPTILVAGLLAFLTACGDVEADRTVVVVAHGRETSGTSVGGGVVVVTGSGLEVDRPAWLFGEPETFTGPLPPTSLLAIGDALFRAGRGAEVLDAIRTGDGTVALLRGPEGKVLLHHFGTDRAAWSEAPAGARRVLPATDRPLTVRLLVADAVVVTATRCGHE